MSGFFYAFKLFLLEQKIIPSIFISQIVELNRDLFMKDRNEADESKKGMVPSNTVLFEIAWEVCNQVGGIYTVIRSKVPSAIEKWGNDNYFLIGPYFEDQANAHFDPAIDYSSPIGKAVLKMQGRGFDVHYGQWIVSGRPQVIL